MKRSHEELANLDLLVNSVRTQLSGLGFLQDHISLLFYFDSAFVKKLKMQIEQLVSQLENIESKNRISGYLNNLLAHAVHPDDTLNEKIIYSIHNNIGIIRQYIDMGFEAEYFVFMLISQRRDLPQTFMVLKEAICFFKDVISFQNCLGEDTKDITQELVEFLLDTTEYSFYYKLALLANHYTTDPGNIMGPKAPIIFNRAKSIANAADLIEQKRNNQLVETRKLAFEHAESLINLGQKPSTMFNLYNIHPHSTNNTLPKHYSNDIDHKRLGT